MTRNKLYLIIFLGLTAGYCWLTWSLLDHQSHTNEITVCFFKNATGVACPSCGSTRSLLAITKGNFSEALLINPFGYIILTALTVLPLWLLFDVITKNNSLHKAYIQFEKTVKTKWIATLLVILTLANWAWNIYKGL